MCSVVVSLDSFRDGKRNLNLSVVEVSNELEKARACVLWIVGK